MAVITSIKEQKSKNKLGLPDRVNIYLDDKFGFGIDIDNFVILGLKINQEVSEEEISQIVKKAEFQKTLEKLLRFAVVRPRSEKEVRDWLRRKKVPEVIHKDLFSRLKEFDLIDDAKFAKWWVDVRQSFSPKSKRILKQELQIKGIDRNIIEDVFAETKIDENKIALAMLMKKKYTDEKKMFGYLARNGFGFETIKLAVRQFVALQKKAL